MSTTSPTSEHASAATNQSRRSPASVRRGQRHRGGEQCHERGRLAQVFEPRRSGVARATQSPTANTPATTSRATRRRHAGAAAPTSPCRALTPGADHPMGPSFWAIDRHGRLLALPHLGDPCARIRRAAGPCSPPGRRHRGPPGRRPSSRPGRGPGPAGGPPGRSPVATASSAVERRAREHHPRRLLRADAPGKEPAAPRLGARARASRRACGSAPPRRRPRDHSAGAGWRRTPRPTR